MGMTIDTMHCRSRGHFLSFKVDPSGSFFLDEGKDKPDQYYLVGDRNHPLIYSVNRYKSTVKCFFLAFS